MTSGIYKTHGHFCWHLSNQHHFQQFLPRVIFVFRKHMRNTFADLRGRFGLLRGPHSQSGYTFFLPGPISGNTEVEVFVWIGWIDLGQYLAWLSTSHGRTVPFSPSGRSETEPPPVPAVLREGSWDVWRAPLGLAFNRDCAWLRKDGVGLQLGRTGSRLLGVWAFVCFSWKGTSGPGRVRLDECACWPIYAPSPRQRGPPGMPPPPPPVPDWATWLVTGWVVPKAPKNERPVHQATGVTPSTSAEGSGQVDVKSPTFLCCFMMCSLRRYMGWVDTSWTWSVLDRARISRGSSRLVGMKRQRSLVFTAPNNTTRSQTSGCWEDELQPAGNPDPSQANKSARSKGLGVYRTIQDLDSAPFLHPEEGEGVSEVGAERLAERRRTKDDYRAPGAPQSLSPGCFWPDLRHAWDSPHPSQSAPQTRLHPLERVIWFSFPPSSTRGVPRGFTNTPRGCSAPICSGWLEHSPPQCDSPRWAGPVNPIWARFHGGRRSDETRTGPFRMKEKASQQLGGICLCSFRQKQVQ